ncbi:hypothetical protein [Yoonia sp. SDW83-1]|uniref:hypothetical protein n=1 Tax=Yoonia sp. SDW83-1 TaxID=3366945 RepID=UPI00398C65EC
MKTQKAGVFAKRWLGLPACSIAALLAVSAATITASVTAVPVFAEDHDSDGDHGGGRSGGGQRGSGSGGQGGGHDSGDGHDSGSGGEGLGGSGQGGGGGNAQQGQDRSCGRPIWAQEGIPDVELDRLNVARSPTHVLDRAFDEAIASFTPEMTAFYSQSLDEIISEISLNLNAMQMIDSPLQNLAMVRDAVDGTSALAGIGVRNDVATLLAVTFGTVADKNMPVTADAIMAVSVILGQPFLFTFRGTGFEFGLSTICRGWSRSRQQQGRRVDTRKPGCRSNHSYLRGQYRD